MNQQRETTLVVINKSIEKNGDVIVINSLKENEVFKTVSDSKVDTLPVNNITNAKPTAPEINKPKKWILLLNAGIGISNSKNNLPSNTSVYADAMQLNSSGGISASPQNQQTAAGTAGTNKSLSFNVGINAERLLNKRWSVITGLNYLYQSNKLGVGASIDSEIFLNFDEAKSFSSKKAYRLGNEKKYLNQFHTIEVPLIFKYTPKLGAAFTFQAGPSIGYLLHSNALVYSITNRSYATNSIVFSNLQLSFNIGGGYTLGKKTQHPIAVGYQFKYGLTPVVKPVYGKQHLANSMLFVRIPLKK
jgi:hypothetical protein